MRTLATHASVALRPLEDGATIRPLRSLSASAPGDSTNEACQDSEWCGIQGDIAGGLVGVQCVSGTGTCGNASYLWSIRNAPPNSTTTFTPNPQVVDQPSELIIQTTDSTPPGIYQSTVVITPVGSSPPAQPDTIPITVHIVCNYRLSSCPEIEILDLTQGPSVVVSAPQPRQDTYMGRPMRLRMRQKAGTGGTRSYTMIAGTWTLYGGQQSAVKSYDISTGTLTPLTAPEDINTMSWYYVISNNSSQYPILAEATLSSTDAAIFGPRATAQYRAQGPTPTVQVRTVPVQVGFYDVTPGMVVRNALSLGKPQPGLQGFVYNVAAGAPPGDDGYMASTQLASTDWNGATNPLDPPLGLPPRTNGAYWLDGCPIYKVAVKATGGTYLFDADDSPGWILTDQWNQVSRFDAFKTYLMYRPSGPNSIWVPVMKSEWFWTGGSTRTSGANSATGGWGPPEQPDWTRSPAFVSSSEFPTWGSGQVLSPGNCQPLPTQ